jgi:DNA-binding response OmpR family regulator
MSNTPQTPLTQAELGELRHDMRTPFNAIIGYAEMLQESAQDEGQSALDEGLGHLVAEARDLLAIVNAALATGQEVRLADLSRLGAQVQARVGPLSAHIQGLLAQVRQAGMNSALPDMDRIGAAVGNLTRLTAERLLGHHEAAPRPAEPFEAAERPSPAPPVPSGAGVVLVVDDNGLNRDLLCRRLERAGYQGLECPGGREALEALDRGGIDLVLLDILMPEVDGYEVLRQVKSSEKLRDVPVIMISALDDLGSVVRCIELGAEDYLPKPFDPVLLRARVGACLEKKRLRDTELEYLKGVRAVQEAAASVETGSFEPASLDSVAGRDDELGRLARVFQNMAREVRAREERLKSEVQKLKIEIDDSRKQREVAQIMESDFAQDLVTRARQLRQRMRKPDAG